MGRCLIVHSSSFITMMSLLSLGSFSVSGVGDDEDDEWIVNSSVGAWFRCTCEFLSTCHVDSIRCTLGLVCRYTYVLVDSECLDGHLLVDG